MIVILVLLIILLVIKSIICCFITVKEVMHVTEKQKDRLAIASFVVAVIQTVIAILALL